VQHLRLSQFILTYGPGAIIEGPRGPRLIPRPDIGLFTGNLRPEDFEISDERISEGLLKGGRIFRLPTAAELGWTDRPVYRTRVFPEWWICSQHWKLFMYRDGYRDGCPECRRENVQGYRRKWDAVRFVMACAKGHLDDVNWHFAVHARTGGACRRGTLPRYYNWKSAGGSLRDIKVECPQCGASVSIGDLYGREWACSGRYPEREPLNSSPQREGCDERAIMVLRQASNLRVPEVFPVFTLRLYTELHNLLALREVRGALSFANKHGKLNSRKDLEEVLNTLVECRALSRDVAVNILEHPWDEIRRVMDEILALPSVTSPVEIIRDEFEVFQRASEEGAPPVRGRTRSRVVFEVPEDRIRKNVRGPCGLKFRVAPATRLRTVLVQLGYRRYVRRISRSDPEEMLRADLVPVHFMDSQGTRWYPGVEMLGEGIFIRLEDSARLVEDGDAWNAWLEAFRLPDPRYRRSNALQRDGEELHPGFVWWHTLSHLLIRTLSIDSGYSSASIRERVYFRNTDRGFTGGIVLYTVQPGEGTMGGLVSQIDNFEATLQRAFEIAEICPNDPLCADHSFRNGLVAGSACYACLFVSETSCEHRNMWLDRKVLLEGAGCA